MSVKVSIQVALLLTLAAVLAVGGLLIVRHQSSTPKPKAPCASGICWNTLTP